MNIDIEKSLKYSFEDPDWLMKLGLLALLSLVPILGTPIVIFGYTIAILRNVAAGADRPLPRWDNFTEILLDGVKLAVIGLVYSLPAWLVCSVPITLVAAGGLLAGDRRGSPGEIITYLGGFAILPLICILFLYLLAVMFVWPAVLVLYSRTRRLATGFAFGEIYRFIRDNLSLYVIVWFMVLVVTFAVSLIPTIIGMVPFVGWALACLLPVIAPLVSAYTAAVSGHLYGQLSRLSAGGAGTGGAASSPVGDLQ